MDREALLKQWEEEDEEAEQEERNRRLGELGQRDGEAWDVLADAEDYVR